MSADFRVAVDFFEHHKARKLKRRIGADGLVSLLQLWGYASKLRTNGDLSGMSEEDIEIAAHWDGQEGLFVSTLKEIGFLDEEDGDFILHDWIENNPWVAGTVARSDASRLSRMAKVMPDEYKTLVDAGVKGVSKKDYEELRIINDRSTIVKRIVNDAVSPTPTPAPAPSPVPEEKSINNLGNTENVGCVRECNGSQVDCSLPDPVPLPDLNADPGIEFQELRQFYDANARPEAPLSGFGEYKQLRASKQWPGLGRITDAIAKQQAADPEGWQQFAPGLGKFLKEHWWRKEPAAIKSRASPKLTPSQQKAQHMDDLAKFVLAADKELKNGNNAAHISGTGTNGYALPPGTQPQPV